MPREAFGMHKRALFLGRRRGPSDFLTPELRGGLPAVAAVTAVAVPAPAGRSRRHPPGTRSTRRLQPRDPTARRRLHRYVIHWAVDRTMERYPKPRQS